MSFNFCEFLIFFICERPCTCLQLMWYHYYIEHHLQDYAKFFLSVPLISFNDITHVRIFHLSFKAKTTFKDVFSSRLEGDDEFVGGDWKHSGRCCLLFRLSFFSISTKNKFFVIVFSTTKLNLKTKANEIIAKWISRTSNVVRFKDGGSCTL